MAMLSRLDHLFTLWLFRPLISIRRATSAPSLPILMYHSVSNQPEPGVRPYYQTRTAPPVFATQMAWLKANAYRGLDLQTALEELSDDRPNGAAPVAITFDDGFQDVYTQALPALQRVGFTATAFLPTDYIAESRRSFEGMPCLTWQEVQELRRAGIKFGSHTVTHPVLYECEWPRIESELRRSRAVLEHQLQETVTTFAYPYRYPEADRPFVAKFTAHLKAAGYTCCVTTCIGRVRPLDNRYLLKRLPVNSKDDSRLFRAKLLGAYDWLGRIQFLLKHLRLHFRRREAG